MDLIEKRVIDYINDVDDKSSAPGGGSVASLVGALGIALAKMLAHFSFDKKKFKDADGLVVGSPVYYASANATLVALLDRVFYSSARQFDKTMKVGASVVSARRGGNTATFDELNKYFTISGMPVVSSQYWNQIHGNNVEQALQDEEGLQTMRTLGRNMAFLMKSIALGKEAFGMPETEPKVATNFIR